MGNRRCQRVSWFWLVYDHSPTRQLLLLEIETAKLRHAWAKAEVKRGEPSAALVKYLGESLQELRVLKSMVGSEAAKP